jgi:hypothetical protein
VKRAFLHRENYRRGMIDPRNRSYAIGYRNRCRKVIDPDGGAEPVSRTGSARTENMQGKNDEETE